MNRVRTAVMGGVLAMALWAPMAGAQDVRRGSDVLQDRRDIHRHTDSDGAFDRLSPGNQKIARSLFEAQPRPGAGTFGGPTRRSLDDIAAMKESGKGWGVIFKDMRREGLVRERNLGQVVRGEHGRRHDTGITSGSSRPHVMPGPHDTVITSGSGHSYVMAGPQAPGQAAARTAAVNAHARAGADAATSRGHDYGSRHGGGK